MRSITLTFTALLTSVGLMAQPQFDNAGYETWDGSGNTLEPTDWSSLKTSSGGVSGLAPQVAFQSTDAHTGTYSVRLRTGSAVGQTASGLLTNGRVHATLSGGYTYTDQANSSWHTALTDRPDSIVIWYKYTPVSNDFATLEAVLHVNSGELPPGTTGGNWVGTASWSATAGATVSSWTRASVPFTYTSENAPQFILVALTSSDGVNAVQNSEVIYDDIALIYNVTPQASEQLATVTPTEGFPLFVDFSTSGTPVAATAFTAELSDASGSFASPVAIGSLTTSATSGTIAAEIPAGTASGSGYLIRVTAPSPYYAPVSTGIEVELDFGVGIAQASPYPVRAYCTDGLIHVDMRHAGMQSPSWELVSVTGQRIAQGVFSTSDRATVPADGLRGVYVIRLSDGTRVASQRVTVM